MRKKIYVEFNEALLQSLQKSLSYKSGIVNELLEHDTWFFYLRILGLLSRCFDWTIEFRKI